MDCSKYSLKIGLLIDGDLDSVESADVMRHVSQCEDCGRTFEDLTQILNFAKTSFEEEASPPNSRALWCRINNIIETEILPETEKPVAKPKRRFRDFARELEWKLSPSQVIASVIGIALVSSLLTFIGVRNFLGPEEIHSDATLQPSLIESMLSRIGIVETPNQKFLRQMDEQKSAIAYWEKRVELRKIQWDAHLQDAFNRNLREIDKAVNGYAQALEKNPNDKISNEMLDSALSEKMNFLREFAEL